MKKYCINCGKKMDSDATFCVECGTFNKGEYKYDFAGEEHTFNQLAVSGLILSFFMPPIGLIVSIIGLVRSKNQNDAGRKPAIAGIIVSSIFISLWFLNVLLTVILQK